MRIEFENVCRQPGLGVVDVRQHAREHGQLVGVLLEYNHQSCVIVMRTCLAKHVNFVCFCGCMRTFSFSAIDRLIIMRGVSPESYLTPVCMCVCVCVYARARVSACQRVSESVGCGCAYLHVCHKSCVQENGLSESDHVRAMHTASTRCRVLFGVCAKL